MSSYKFKMNCNHFHDTFVAVFGFLFTVTNLFNNGVFCGAMQLDHSNIDMTLSSNELVMINFYADWCKFSNKLQPIFDEAADKIKELFGETGSVVFGKVDCDEEDGIATRFHITRYPTLKVIRNGKTAKRYKGQRSVEAFVEFVKKQIIRSLRNCTLSFLEIQSHEFE